MYFSLWNIHSLLYRSHFIFLSSLTGQMFLQSLQDITWTRSSGVYTTISDSSLSPWWIQKLPPNTSNYATDNICSENTSGTCTQEQDSGLDSSHILELRKTRAASLCPQRVSNRSHCAESFTSQGLGMLGGTILSFIRTQALTSPAG